MMIDFAIFLGILVSVIFLIEVVYKSKCFSTFRMIWVWWQTEIETRCVLFMKKYKSLYRIIIELVIIWFIFEWKNKLIITKFMQWWSIFCSKIEPVCIKIKELFLFLSPYGREIIKNEIVNNWMQFFSKGLLCVIIIYIIAILLGGTRKIYKLIMGLLAMMIDWYALLFIAFIFSKIPQMPIMICWGIAIVCFGIIQITIFGILSEVT